MGVLLLVGNLQLQISLELFIKPSDVIKIVVIYFVSDIKPFPGRLEENRRLKICYFQITNLLLLSDSVSEDSLTLLLIFSSSMMSC